MRGKTLGAIACAGIFSISALAQESSTSVDSNGKVITTAKGETIQTSPLSSMPIVRQPRATGGVVAIPEFTGERQDGFEPPQHPNNEWGYHECLLDLAFQGAAFVCARAAQITTDQALGCRIYPHGPNFQYEGRHGPIRFTFVDGMEPLRFGGYFGTNNPEEPNATVDFYGLDLSFIDSVLAEYPNDCTWTWLGWESAIPIKMIVITGFWDRADLVFLDDLEWSPVGSGAGACCLPDGSCKDDMPQVECIQAGGDSFADTPCADLDPPCREQVGACCIEIRVRDGCTRDPEWQCDGDTDGDGQVNPVDSGLVQAAFGSVDDQDLCNYDVDCDGQINPVDSGIVQSLFGTCDAPRDSCEGDGCEIITGTECRERGGEFHWYGTDCEDDPCGFATGACCLSTECAETTRRSACDEMGGAWFRGQTCPEFEECPEAIACDWNNGIVPNGFSARALSPPQFPDIRVVDDVFIEIPGCKIWNFRVSVVHDEDWFDDGLLTVFVYEDTGSGPGDLLVSVDSPYRRIATGDTYFGRAHFEYLIAGLDLDLPAGKSWIGFRNGSGSGTGTNWWMTSDGGTDGQDSDTGWFRADEGFWRHEGFRWHHAFELTP